jgi:putative ABC transport system permease protein
MLLVARQGPNYRDMIPNFFKSSWRSLTKDRQFTLLNVIGLATGLACTLLIYLWVSDERSVDRFNEKDSRIYEAMRNSPNGDGTISTWNVSPGLMAASMAKDFPEVAYAVASRNEGTGIVSYLDSTITGAGSSGKYERARMQLVGEDFFRIFSYPILEGDKRNPLSDPSDAMISDKLALQLFNTTKAVVGRRIEWGGAGPKGSYTVAGVFKAPPANATDQFDLLLPYALYVKKEAEDVANWGSNGVVTYLLLKEGTDIHQFNAKIKDYASSRAKWEGDLFLQKYSDRYLYNRYENGVQVGGRIEYVRLFSIIAIFILIIACINFMNLSTARASGRVKEVGVRKVIGARRGSLVLQFMGESVLMAFLSLLLAMLLVSLFLPVFRGITGKELHLVADTGLILTAGCLTLVTGLVAGSYPALYLSGFRPVAVLKGNQGYRRLRTRKERGTKLRRSSIASSLGETLIRKGLVVFQFTVSVSLIITVLIVYRQMNLIQTTNLGYNRDHVLHFSTEGKQPGGENAFLTEVRSIPGVVGASGMDGDMTGGYSQGGDNIDWKGKYPNQDVEFEGLDMDYGMIEMLGMQMKEGRPFSRAFGSDTSSVIFNEAAIAAMGLKDPIGQYVTVWRHKMQIIGVVRDFHFESLYKKIPPFFFRCQQRDNQYVYVKLKAGRERETIARLETVYKQFHEGLAFEYRFLDDDYQALYESEQRVSVLSRYFAGIAILISCLGLFGLAAFTAQKRQKEIGIRKVVGASAPDVVVLLSKDFLRLMLLAILIAFPVAGWSMHQWLKGFAYRVAIDPLVFVLAGVSILFITLITISFQAVKAALANPIESLRSE